MFGSPFTKIAAHGARKNSSIWAWMAWMASCDSRGIGKGKTKKIETEAAGRQRRMHIRMLSIITHITMLTV